MENTQLSLLSLLGGKSPLEGLGGAKLRLGDEQADLGSDVGAEGFFTTLEELLTANSGDEELAALDGADAGLQNAPLPGSVGASDLFGGALELFGEAADGENIAPVTNGLVDIGLVTNTGNLVAGVSTGATLNTPNTANAAVLSNENAALLGRGAQPEANPDALVDIDTPRVGVENMPLNKSGNPFVQAGSAPGNAPGGALGAASGIGGVQAELPIGDLAQVSLRSDGDLALSDRAQRQSVEIATAASDKSLSINPVRDQIMAAVSARANDGRVEVRLDPPELGRVVINFTSEGGELARAVVSADASETLDLLRRHADQLQRALEQQGFENLDLEFSQHHAQDGAGDDGDAGFTNVQLASSAGAVDHDAVGAEPRTQYIELGRLDRRL